MRRRTTAALLLVECSVLMVTWNGVRFGNAAIVDFVMLPASVAVLVHVLSARQRVPIPAWLLAPGIAIGMAAVLTTLLPVGHGLARTMLAAATAAGALATQSNGPAAVEFVIAIVIVPLLVAAVATTPRRCRDMADLWALSCIVSGAIAITDLLGSTHISSVSSGSDQRQSGLTGHPNDLGLTCAMALPVVVVWFARGGRWRQASLGAGGVLLGAVYASGSRAGTAVAVFAVLATILLVPRLRRALPTLVPVLGMLAVLVSFSGAPAQIARKVRLSGSVQDVTPSNRARSLAATLALTEVQARPVEGVGFGVINDAHDIYLELLASGGVVVFAAFLIYLRGLARMAWRVGRGSADAVGPALAVALAVWLLNGLVGTEVADRFIFVPVGVLLALSMWTAAPPPEEETGGGGAPVTGPQIRASAR